MGVSATGFTTVEFAVMVLRRGFIINITNKTQEYEEVKIT